MTAGEGPAAAAVPSTTADAPDAPFGPVQEAAPNLSTPTPSRPAVTADTMIEALEESLDREQRFQQLTPARRQMSRPRVPNGGRVRLATSADRQPETS